MKILLIDGSGVMHSALHALPSFSFEGVDTSIIYGFLNQLSYLQKTFDADRIVFAFDGKSSKREEIFPAYKAKRKAQRKAEKEKMSSIDILALQNVMKQFTIVQHEVLPALGFNNLFSQEGYEGDDIIASVCNKYKAHKIVIVANDKDLYQLITANHKMYSILGRDTITEEVVCQRYGIHPSRFGEMKSISGCTSDEVPGVPGVGDTKAVQYLCGDMNVKSKTFQKIKASDDIIAFTRKLVVLPFEGVETFKVKEDSCTINKFKRVIREYGFKSMREPGYILDLQRCFCAKTCIPSAADYNA